MRTGFNERRSSPMFLDFRREVVRISHEGGIKYHGGDAGMSLLFGVSGDCWRGLGKFGRGGNLDNEIFQVLILKTVFAKIR